MSSSVFKRTIVITVLSMISTLALAKRMRYLIKYKDNKPVAQLATKWTKIDGGYEFTLDEKLEVANGKTVNAEMVKASIEKRIKRKGMTIEVKSQNTLKITFNGDENDFWKTLSRARIKASNVQIAMDGSGSSGGIRANKIARQPRAGEVRASFISMDPKTGEMEVFVYAVGPDGIPAAIKPSKKLRIKTPKGMKNKLKKDDIVYFRPIRLDGESWSTKGITFK